MSIQKFHAEMTSSKQTSALFRAFRQLNRVNANDLPKPLPLIGWKDTLV